MRLTREVMRGRMGADMARQPRIEYAGATYHVMARGNHGQAIYRDEKDRRLWLETLGEVCKGVSPGGGGNEVDRRSDAGQDGGRYGPATTD
jgi:hypothetical protein